MKKTLLLLSLLLISFVALQLSVPSVVVHAQTQDELDKQLQEKQAEIAQLQAHLDDARNQEKTLKSQLDILDSQAKITQLKIEETNTKIEKLKRDITTLSGRIDRLSTTVDDISQVLLKRIVETYKYGNLNIIDLLFSSSGFSDLIERLKYMQVAQANDKKVLYQLQATKAAYDDQKKDKVTAQTEAEKLNAQLAGYKTQLDQQTADKQRLIEVTKNNEARYQQLLSQARAEYLAIQGIVAGKGTEHEVGQVGTGQKIATMIVGASCNSGGTHLHFTVSQNGATQNPFSYLKPISYENCSGSSCGSSDGDSFNPSGSWDWPIDGPIQFNQGYGPTWAVQHQYVGSIYSFHNGIDIVGPSLDVKAVQPGTLYKGSYSGVAGCTLPYVRVHQNDGLDTFYLHVL